MEPVSIRNLNMLSGPSFGSLVVVTITYAAFKYLQARRSPLNVIPTVGHSGILTSYITAIKYRNAGAELIQEGYDKYQGRPFKIATLSRWVVVLSGEVCVRDVCNAPEDVLSLNRPLLESTQAKHTFGSELLTDPYHVITVRNLVTRNLGARFEDIRDEVVRSCEDYIPQGKGWVTVPAYETLMHLTCRTANRYFIGLPLCRDRRILALGEELSHKIVEAGRTIGLFPELLRPFVSRYSGIPKIIQEGHDLLAPVIEERLARHRQPGSDINDQPNDVFSWLIKTATRDYHFTAYDMARRIVMMNVAAIHATSKVLTQVLYDLAVHPEYLSELREEVETTVAEHGWSKASMQKMHKVDSFLKESHRLNTVSNFLMVRQTIKNWTLSDGTVVPPGVNVGIAAGAMNRAEELYPDSGTFKGFRFAEMRQGDGERDSIKHQMVCLSPEAVSFGYGRHACPGRFFAVSAIKTAFAHILLNYDVQFENGSMERPSNTFVEVATTPDTEANLMLRKRDLT